MWKTGLILQTSYRNSDRSDLEKGEAKAMKTMTLHSNLPNSEYSNPASLESIVLFIGILVNRLRLDISVDNKMIV